MTKQCQVTNSAISVQTNIFIKLLNTAKKFRNNVFNQKINRLC